MGEGKLTVDIGEIIVNSFLGYKFRKWKGILYSTDSKVPVELIKLYYSQDSERLDYDTLKKSFVNRYIKSESKLEDIHVEEEIQGLASMYEYIHEIPKDEFEMFSILTLHRKLYSKCPFPDAGGKFRNRNVYLPGTGTETCDYSYLFERMIGLEDTVKSLMNFASQMRESNNYSDIFEFVSSCVKLKCALIKMHPFEDGNGRTIRCFINRIFEEAGIPPVYIKANERTEYHTAMNKANNDDDYTSITNFYLYKICDSIIELDINERMKAERERVKESKELALLRENNNDRRITRK